MTDGDDDDDEEDAETDANGGEAVCERERVVSGLWWRMLLRFRGTRGDGRCDSCSAISQGKNEHRLSCATHPGHVPERAPPRRWSKELK